MNSRRIGRAYDLSASAWASGPDRVYRQLAEVMLAASPINVAGSRVLDVGSGGGAATRAAMRMGAGLVVATDLSAEMLRSGPTSPDVQHIVADVNDLPFRAAAFDLVMAACCLGHLADPIRGLREALRVSPAIVATAFAAGWTHPAKSAVDEAMREFGFVTPNWYLSLKNHTEPLVDDPARFRSLALAAGWGNVEVTIRQVQTGLAAPADLVGWRWGMAHLAPFVASLDPGARTRARRAAERAVEGCEELVVPLVILAASRPQAIS